MDPNLAAYLKKHKIEYKIHEHPAVFTVAESSKLERDSTITYSKNLFLKDESEKFFLVCVPSQKQVDLKKLKQLLEAKKKLFFASPEELKEHLTLTPGSVSIFGMIYSSSVSLILDKALWEAEKVGFHPNINTATLELTHKNLEKFYLSLSVPKKILDVPQKEK